MWNIIIVYFLSVQKQHSMPSKENDVVFLVSSSMAISGSKSLKHKAPHISHTFYYEMPGD